MSKVLGDVVEVASFGLVKGDELTGESQRRAAQQAAQTQAQGGQAAIDYLKGVEQRQTARLDPFTQLLTPELAQRLQATAGGSSYGGITPLQAQAISPVNPMSDPAFKSLADEASRRVFANQAARGKLGSGGTAEALQERLVGLGEQVRGQRLQEQLATRGQYAGEQAQQFGQQMQLASVPQQQQFNQLMQLAGLSQSAAAGQSAAGGQMGQNISDMMTQIANAQAAGQVGSAAARSQAMQGLLGLGGQLGGAMLLSDMRLKRNIRYQHEINGVPMFTFDYIDGPENQYGTMAQLVMDDYPEAVKEIDGFYHVDYARLPIWH